jgi:hypothetical protein
MDATVTMATMDIITGFVRFRFSVDTIITVMAVVALGALCQSLAQLR